MEQHELYSKLQLLGLPIAYSHFECDEDNKPPQPPFLVYFVTGRDDVVADNTMYITKTTYALELYTDSKDLEIEKKIEDKLTELELPFDKQESYIESERLFEVYYEFEIMGG